MRRWRVVATLIVATIAAGALSLLPVGGTLAHARGPNNPAPSMDLSAFSDAPPGRHLRVLFIHHSIGGHLLARHGPPVGGAHDIWQSHPNGGGMRDLLEAAGYEVHEASYDSRVGNDTDMFDWLPKFGDHMDEVLRVDLQDKRLPKGEHNDVVMFKSCFPNSYFVGEGRAPGNPRGPELTVANAKATMTAVRAKLEKHPEVLFVYFTTPPQAPRIEPQPAWKWLARKMLGRHRGPAALRRSGDLAREFADWMKAPNGWLRGYPEQNIVVFDYYDVLTGNGVSNLLHYPTRNGYDSHPSSVGQRQAAAKLVPFLNRAVRRAGLLAVR
jgi:hypothetical protein